MKHPIYGATALQCDRATERQLYSATERPIYSFPKKKRPDSMTVEALYKCHYGRTKLEHNRNRALLFQREGRATVEHGAFGGLLGFGEEILAGGSCSLSAGLGFHDVAVFVDGDFYHYDTAFHGQVIDFRLTYQFAAGHHEGDGFVACWSSAGRLYRTVEGNRRNLAQVEGQDGAFREEIHLVILNRLQFAIELLAGL